MNPPVLTIAPPSGPLPKLLHWLRHPELRVFLIQWGFFVLTGMIFAYFDVTYDNAALAARDPVLFKFKGDLWAYFLYALWNYALWTVVIQSDYWLFRWLFRKDGIWRGIVFAVLQFGYLILFVAIEVLSTKSVHAPKMGKDELLSELAAAFLYTLIFVAIRAFRYNRRERKLTERERVETERRYKEELDRTRQQAEIAALKAQVNPHFLFNTLNNLYGTALSGDTARTAAGIEQLSAVMRHVVEESRHDYTPVAKEIRFLQDTIDLHRMRLPRQDSIQITARFTNDEAPAPTGEPVQIAPLLLVSFIENAFKYGISVAAPCFVDIRLTVEAGQLAFWCQNSVLPHNRLEASTGTGIDNIRQRLRLLYPHRHTLAITEENEVFTVALTVDLLTD